MKNIIISFITWTFIMPSVIAIYLILIFLRVSMLDLFLALTGLVVALAILAVMRGLLWTP